MRYATCLINGLFAISLSFNFAWGDDVIKSLRASSTADDIRLIQYQLRDIERELIRIGREVDLEKKAMAFQTLGQIRSRRSVDLLIEHIDFSFPDPEFTVGGDLIWPRWEPNVAKEALISVGLPAMSATKEALSQEKSALRTKYLIDVILAVEGPTRGTDSVREIIRSFDEERRREAERTLESLLKRLRKRTLSNGSD
ncbi:hypothetical protein [Stratiformator vulcanicus]|uniref:HEAT repeat domain-containing protein n=1 Tax=Stratiformator vulcanicus TaxID=2527980 RepID=A0A517QVS3_9PLAN|nr:hypothetical protein [Stratiformator vulcanicus]QDT35752.1 hypothetical protein Pan189_01050 [Stratiformator vulcanicus]